MNYAEEYLKKLDFSNKIQVVRDIIDKVIVSERSGAKVWAHLPLPVTITEKLGYEPERRDAQDVIQHFVPFRFKLRLPPLRKARIIIERNKTGHIEKARAPYVKTHHFKQS